MDSAHWKKIQDLFHAAADLPQQEQRAFVKNACGENDALAAEVLALLAEDSQGSSLLDRDVAHIAGQVFDESTAPSLAFKEFGPYRIKQMLGEGGMGVVYLAERSDLGTQVAIKFLRDAWLSPARRERFASEQRTLAQLNHSSIARLYDADTLDDGTPWFVMEYVEGLPLTEYCRRNQCSIERRLQLFRAVCEAVLYAHQHAVIHRDLKPSNILVKNDGSVRLLDFGIAKQIENLETPVEQTRDGLRLMTPAYASPEQIPRRARGHPRGCLFTRRDSLRIARRTPPIRFFKTQRSGGGKNYRRVYPRKAFDVASRAKESQLATDARTPPQARMLGRISTCCA